MSRLTNALKKNVAASQQWKCQACSSILEATYEIDHITPKCKGGTNDENNLQALCPNCHRKKTRKDIAKPAATKKTKIQFPPGYANGMPGAKGWAENYIETQNKKIQLDRYKSLNVDELRVLVAKWTNILDLKKTKKELTQIMDGIKSSYTQMRTPQLNHNNSVVFTNNSGFKSYGGIFGAGQSTHTRTHGSSSNFPPTGHIVRFP